MEWKPGKIFIIEGSLENLLCGRRSVKWGKVPVAAKVGKKVPVARFFLLRPVAKVSCIKIKELPIGTFALIESMDHCDAGI